ncbi:MAG: KUP/HAK/KT family potassium transporter [Verrucomicrobia bacterium]|nr:KUP/HAK/KT family potassium transporter [Verrucomicrobiota bacterium]
MSHSSTTPLKAGAQSVLCLGALGVVFGDIGTSPLYTMKECLGNLPAGVARADGILGVLSLIFWVLILVVSVKYIWYVMRADNHGEGGIFALLALLSAGKERSPKHRLGPIVIMILVGAALLFGDGIITPAISVLGAAEGLTAISPSFTPPRVAFIACVILFILFWIQKKGTKQIGGIFGPVMLVWFATLGVLGLWHITSCPSVLRALDPRYGLALLKHSPMEISALLGAVVLAITGAEALYADMGHFGRRYIAIAWYGVVFPALFLNYFGQGAYALTHPGMTENPFFALAPQGLPRAFLTGLSILAAIIASQALISGAYSLTRQAIQLGYFPRLKINYTNAEHSGQIYVPFVNTLLAIGCILTVVLFGSTDHLAAAYGIAVTGTMAITTIAYYLVTQKTWEHGRWAAAPICLVFLFVDLAFLSSNADKIFNGGWFPLAIGAAILAVMHTWKIGRQEIYIRVYGNNVTESELVSIARSKHVTRVGGAAVFMVGSPSGTPIALLHHVKANRCLHQTVVLLSIVTEEVPTVPAEKQLTLTEIGEGIWRAIGRYGYMESPDVGVLLDRVHDLGVPINPQGAIYFFNREMIITDGSAPMWKWQKSLYALLSRNARPVKDYYQITPSQIIEIGLPIQL